MRSLPQSEHLPCIQNSRLCQPGYRARVRHLIKLSFRTTSPPLECNTYAELTRQGFSGGSNEVATCNLRLLDRYSTCNQSGKSKRTTHKIPQSAIYNLKYLLLYPLTVYCSAIGSPAIPLERRYSRNNAAVCSNESRASANSAMLRDLAFSSTNL